MRAFSLTFAASRIALALALSTTLSHAGAAKMAAPITAAERDFLGQMGLEKYGRVQYKDAKGASITFSQFQKLQPAFPSFSMQKTNKGNLAVAVIALQAAETKRAQPQYNLKRGSAFPAFKLAATDSTVVDSTALRGKYTLINFYFADCAPCVREVPMLNAFAAKHKDMAVLALTFDDDKVAKAFAVQTRFGWRTIANASKLIDAVGVKAYPTFALLDPKGALLAFGDQDDVGGKDGALEQWVAKMIAAKKI
ncbi:MAG: TlpA disulfide reductase family protein [Telluria sp.]